MSILGQYEPIVASEEESSTFWAQEHPLAKTKDRAPKIKPGKMHQML
jgi:hypothetical protein